MPDDDRIPGYLTAPWRKILRCLQGPGARRADRGCCRGRARRVSEFPEILDTAPLNPTEGINLYRSCVQEWEGLEGASGIGGQLWRQGRTAA